MASVESSGEAGVCSLSHLLHKRVAICQHGRIRQLFLLVTISAGKSKTIVPSFPANGLSACSASFRSSANWPSVSMPPRVHTHALSVAISDLIDANRTLPLCCETFASVIPAAIQIASICSGSPSTNGARNASAMCSPKSLCNVCRQDCRWDRQQRQVAQTQSTSWCSRAAREVTSLLPKAAARTATVRSTTAGSGRLQIKSYIFSPSEYDYVPPSERGCTSL